MKFRLSRKDLLLAECMGRDTVALCEKLMGFKPRLENEKQSRVDANIMGYKAEIAIARLFDIELPAINVMTDGGVDLWLDNVAIDVKFTNKEFGPLIFDSMAKFKSDVAVLVGATSDPAVVRINGAYTRTDFERHCYRKNFGHGERLVMEVKDIQPIEWLWLNLMKRRNKAQK
jgi:hypothetical protein